MVNEKVLTAPEEHDNKKTEERKVKKKRLPAWCWYCDREFSDLQVLITHQRSRHFKCPYCSKRLYSAAGLLVHVAQVHRDRPPLDCVPNAVAGHDGGEWEIYGMRGVPEEDLERWRRGLPILKREGRRGMTGVGLVSILAAQKQAQLPESFYALPSKNSINNNAALLEEGQICEHSYAAASAVVEPELKPMAESVTDSTNIPSADTTNTTSSIQPLHRIIASGKVLKREKNVFD